MAYDEGLAERVRLVMGTGIHVTERKMFGGIVFMVGGNMAVGVSGDELLVRVGPDAYDDAVALPHAREMDFTGRPMRGFVYVSVEGIAEDEDLEAWIDRGASFAASLPPK